MRSINSNQISQLLTNYPLGIKIKFEHAVRQWQNTVCKSISVSTQSSSKSVEKCVPVQQFQFSLDEILNRSSQGLLVTSYYKEHNNLNETCRNFLIDIIISSLIEQNISMSIDITEKISKIFVETFTSELKVDIY